MNKKNKKLKIAIINSFPEYMAPTESDIADIESDMNGKATVINLVDLCPEHIDSFDAVVSFNCVNIFHPEIAPRQVKWDILRQLLQKIDIKNTAIFRRDKYFNGRDIIGACQVGRILRTHKIRVLISVPCYERICKETLKSIYDLFIPDNTIVEFSYQSGYTVVQARNRQVVESLIGMYDYTLFVDSDVVLPQNLLINLMHANADLATGWYIKKIPNGPKITEIYARKRFEDSIENVTEEELVRSAGKIVPISGCGFGCVLIKNSVFADLKEFEGNWFEYVESRKGDKFVICSEDLKFCERLREKNKTLVCDAGLRCFHIGQMLF